MIKNERGEVIANINRTVQGTKLQVCQNRHADFEYDANTTLNEKFDILPAVYPEPKDYPSLNYWAAGRGGHRNIKGPDGADLSEAHYHEIDHMALYDHLPFALRPIDNDLTQEERDKYALRRIEEHHGSRYVAYYLKRLPAVEIPPKLIRVTIIDGVEEVSDFIPSASDLSPTPPQPSNVGVTELAGEYITTTETIKVSLTRQEIDEMVNACVIKYGSAQYAAISEIALVHAKDRVASATDHLGAPFNYKEVIGAQCNTMYCSEPDNIRSSETFGLTFDVGVSDALGIKGS